MRSSFLWLGILGGAIPVTAQNPAATPALVNTPTVHAEVLVTGVLADEGQTRPPISATVIDAEEIEALQATAIADLLRTVPGLDVVRSGTSGKVTSLFTRGTESDHTLVLWNGIELNNPFFGGFDWGLLPTEGVRRVEVVRGPFSALYGSDALGGVVQILTGGADNRLGVEFGENGHELATLTAGAESARARFDVAAHSRRGDGLAENDFYDSEELVASGHWRIGGSGEVGLVVRANESDLGIPFTGGTATPNRTTAWSETEVALPVRFDLGKWAIEGSLSTVSFDSELSAPDDPFGFTFSSSESKAQRGRAVGTFRFDDELWLAVGGDYEDQEVDSGSSFGIDLVGDGQTTKALFSQLYWSPGSWSLDLGVRHDDNDVFGSTTNPRMAAAYAFGSHRVRAAFGAGFRAPSVGELFFPFSGNPELQPEESESLEIAWEYRGEAWEVTLAGFRNDLDNLIDFDFVDFRNVNVGRARTEGVEAGLGRTWMNASLRANATWLDAVDLETELELLRRPEWRGSVVGSVVAGEWAMTATMLHSGERADVDPITFERRENPAWERLDLAVRYRGWRSFVPYARVENITDKEYSEALGFPAPGRQLIGGLTLNF